MGSILVLLGIGIGYAFLTTNLSIQGIANVDSNTWNVYFDNIQVTEGSVSGEQVTQAPTIDTNKTTINYHVRLKEPGDFYEFTVDAKNDGSIDAMIDTFVSTINDENMNIPSYLKYTVRYKDDAEILDNHLLAARSMETFKIRIEFRTDISASDLPSTPASLNLSFSVNYIQSDEESIERDRIAYKYRSNQNLVAVGDNLQSLGESFDSYQEVVSHTGKNYFLKHKLKNDKVEDTAIGYYDGNAFYYLTMDSYIANKEVLNTIFGADKCAEYIDGTIHNYYCDASGIDASQVAVGDINILVGAGASISNNELLLRDDNWICIVYSDGRSLCTDSEDDIIINRT